MITLDDIYIIHSLLDVKILQQKKPKTGNNRFVDCVKIKKWNKMAKKKTLWLLQVNDNWY